MAEPVNCFLHRGPKELYDYEAAPDALKKLSGEARYGAEAGRRRRLLAEQLERSGAPAAAVLRKML